MGEEAKNNLQTLIIKIVIIILTATILCIAYAMVGNVQRKRNIFAHVEKEKQALISEYIVYGNHLNFKGNLNIDNYNIKNLSLYFSTINEENEKNVDLKYQKIENGVEFSTSELINEGIDLEKIESNEYYVFVKVDFEDGTYKYYSMKNETQYKGTERENIEYYTITKNGSNNKIDIKFEEYTEKEKSLEYMDIDVNKTELPEDVYDIVIDPGHRRRRSRSTVSVDI